MNGGRKTADEVVNKTDPILHRRAWIAFFAGEAQRVLLLADPKFLQQVDVLGEILDLSHSALPRSAVAILDSGVLCLMSVEDQEKTVFITSLGAYCYTAMTFSLRNAGAMYQQCMNSCLESQIGHNINVYIDDVVVKATRQDDLVADLAETFANLRRYNIKLNPLKCAFGVPTG
ncbi:hypothetical protein QYE76_032270 [Lolium multiflorum]|uniref:Reverse transcriptase domain-containing protein n=1 Tax=Lolium multiflorum TaxID=4521 RepID=A0AAD8VI71_LOLMU|nr:hypothetical protein QYE76_032270 [Lolium multiflorum]